MADGKNEAVQDAANGTRAKATEKATIRPKILIKIAELRGQVRESFGKVVMAMMGLLRYRDQTLGDLQHHVLEPLILGRVAIAHPLDSDRNAMIDISGVAIWASVSEDVDPRIRERIKAGTFPIRLDPDDWTSGSINWLLDVIAYFKQVVKERELRRHPMVAGLVDKGARENGGEARR